MEVRWGHDQCPSTAQLVYSGRAGGLNWDQSGGSNPHCLPLDPNFLSAISGNQANRAYMELNIKHTQTVIAIFTDVMTLMYHVQFVV